MSQNDPAFDEPFDEEPKPAAEPTDDYRGSMDDKLAQLLKQRREHREYLERNDYAGQLLSLRKAREQELSKTARRSIELLKKREQQAEEALLVDFAVGGKEPLNAGALRIRPSSRPGTMVLALEGGQVVAVRAEDNPLAPVFLLSAADGRATHLGVVEVSNRLKAQLQLFLKAFVLVQPETLLDVAKSF
jgi:hypothetical protein